jgi:hypothetical protein
MIPPTLVRTVPQTATVEAEGLWADAKNLHPQWTYITLRDPIDRTYFPRTRDHWDKCRSGAQLADLVRAEYLFTHGGVYLDSDYEVYRSFNVLRELDGWAGWEDEKHICNAAMGFRAGHSALGIYLDLAIERLGQGTWESGVGTITEVFRDRSDILLLPPGSLYPLHWRAKAMIPQMSTEDVREQNPWAFGIHHWKHSWKEG